MRENTTQIGHGYSSLDRMAMNNTAISDSKKTTTNEKKSVIFQSGFVEDGCCFDKNFTFDANASVALLPVRASAGLGIITSKNVQDSDLFYVVRFYVIKKETSFDSFALRCIR